MISHATLRNGSGETCVWPRVLLSFGLFALLCITAGCAHFLVTNPHRSATEQLLLSTAADRAIASIPWDQFRSKRVYLDTSYFDSYDSRYALGSFRDALSAAGAKLESEVEKSQVVVEVRSGALSIDANDSLVGIPKTGLPVPLSGGVDIPEVALYKSSRQHSTAKFAVFAYVTDSRDHLFSSGSSVGKAYNRQYKLLGIVQWIRTDVPEKKREKKTRKRE